MVEGQQVLSGEVVYSDLKVFDGMVTLMVSEDTAKRQDWTGMAGRVCAQRILDSGNRLLRDSNLASQLC